jgi:hypothetical protein
MMNRNLVLIRGDLVRKLSSYKSTFGQGSLQESRLGPPAKGIIAEPWRSVEVPRR